MTGQVVESRTRVGAIRSARTNTCRSRTIDIEKFVLRSEICDFFAKDPSSCGLAGAFGRVHPILTRGAVHLSRLVVPDTTFDELLSALAKPHCWQPAARSLPCKPPLLSPACSESLRGWVGPSGRPIWVRVRLIAISIIGSIFAIA